MKYILKKGKYKTSIGFGVKIYRNSKTNKFEAILFKFLKRGFWIFDEEAYKGWPQCG